MKYEFQYQHLIINDKKQSDEIKIIILISNQHRLFIIKMITIFQFCRTYILKVLAFLFTLLVIIYFSIAYCCKFIFPSNIPSAFISQITKKMKNCITSITQPSNIELKPHQIIQLAINSMLSMISVLFIMSYSAHMIEFVETISKEVHKIFISLIQYNLPEISSYVGYQYIGKIYLYTGYLGLTAQLALTIDFIRFFNLPTILIYKILAIAYHYLLLSLNLCLKVISHEPNYWLTCENAQDKWIKDNWNWLNIVSYAAIIVMIQLLFFVGFYYIWLSFVIACLMFIINMIKNIMALIDSIAAILFLLKGYNKDIIIDEEERLKPIGKQVLFYFREIAQLVNPINISDIKQLVVGNDIFKIIKNQTFTSQQNCKFNIEGIYKCLCNLQKQ